MMRMTWKSSASVLVMATVLGGALPVNAQTAADADVTEVVVTARKRDERLRDIPTAGTAIGSEELRDMGGIANTQAMLTNLPGVNYANTSNPVTSEVSVRGSGTSRGTSAEAAVGLFRNGVYIGGGQIGGRTFSKVDYFDLGRVEALRGVQGALNGRNAVGGSINIVSARPVQGVQSGYFMGEVGNNKRGEVQLVLNQPLTDTLALRVGATYMVQKEGFYYNPIRDEYFDRQETEAYRAQLGYADGPLTANLLIEHGRDQLPGLMYQVLILPGANPLYPRGLFQDKYIIPWNSPSSAKQQVNYAEFTTSYDMDWATVTATAAIRERTSQNAYDRDASSWEFQAQIRAAGLVAPGGVLGDAGLGGSGNDFARVLFGDIHIVGDKTGPWSWLAGAEVFDLNDKYQNTLSKTPSGTTAATRSPGTVGVSRLDFISWAAYGSVGYDLTEDLTLTGEARYTRDKKDLISDRFDQGTGLPSGVGFNIKGGKESDNFSYNATLAQKVNGWLTYAKIGTAYRAGGFNLALGDPRQPKAIPVAFNDEVAFSYEIGVKGNVTPDIYVNGAIYRTNVDDLLVQGDNGCFLGNPACPVQATSFAYNAGKAELWGIEAEITARADILGGRARVTIGGSHQGGEIVEGPDKGRQGPQRPDWTATFNANYRHELGGDYWGFINFKGNARWGGVQEIEQTPKLVDYQMYDLRAGVEHGGWEAALYSNNVGDESYLVFSGPAARRWNLPRTYGAQLRVRW